MRQLEELKSRLAKIDLGIKNVLAEIQQLLTEEREEQARLAAKRNLKGIVVRVPNAATSKTSSAKDGAARKPLDREVYKPVTSGPKAPDNGSSAAMDRLGGGSSSNAGASSSTARVPRTNSGPPASPERASGGAAPAFIMNRSGLIGGSSPPERLR
jgi:hypothetical protein